MADKPGWRIRAHTQRENHRCLMVWSYDGFDTRIRTFNRDAHEIVALVKRAFDLGREQGAADVLRDVHEALGKHYG
jgi:hypothetical protein